MSSNIESEIIPPVIKKAYSINKDNFLIHNPIKIENEIELKNQAEIEEWLGNGSALNPFIIENLLITNSLGFSPTYGISLNDLQSFIVIQNCYIGISNRNDNPVGIYLGNDKNIIIKSNVIESNRFGIQIVNSENLLIQNNTFRSNNAGIVLDQGNVAIEIKNNVFNDNGAGIWFGGDSSITYIYDNSFTNSQDIDIKVSFSQKELFIYNNNFDNSTRAISFTPDQTEEVFIINNTGYKTATADFPILIAFLTIGIIGKRRLEGNNR
jgi:parallel beta-helix repeat protein